MTLSHFPRFSIWLCYGFNACDLDPKDKSHDVLQHPRQRQHVLTLYLIAGFPVMAQPLIIVLRLQSSKILSTSHDLVSQVFSVSCAGDSCSASTRCSVAAYSAHSRLLFSSSTNISPNDDAPIRAAKKPYDAF